MPKFCPTCGNSSSKIKFYGNFCENCTKEKIQKGLKTEVDIYRCKVCGKIKAAGKDLPPEGRNYELEMQKQFHKYKVHLIDLKEDKALLDIAEETEYGPIALEHAVNIKYKKRMCEQCYKKAGSYHEAIIQLRGNSYKMERFLEKLIRYFESNNEFITKIEQNEHGMDIWVSSKKLTSAFISRMGLHPTTSFTLVGIKNGKKVYKNTYAIRYE